MVEKKLVDKISLLGKFLLEEGIILNLFALVKKEDSTDSWDLVISSKSFKEEEKEVIKKITQSLQKNLTNEELERIARVVVLKPESPTVKNINSAMSVTNSVINIKNSTFNNLLVKEMILFYSIKS
jgi:hypothetical protein